MTESDFDQVPETVDAPHIADGDNAELEALVDVLPPELREGLCSVSSGDEFVDLVLDLGRSPEIRLIDGSESSLPWEVGSSQIEAIVEAIGDFTGDNRAGLPGTLHRFSAIRNRSGRIVGLTVRRGRAMHGTTAIVRDIVAGERSLLLLGPPGVGKTTMLREMARVLSHEQRKRVVIVDTSNEIGGDGDVPHPGIGRARRMQVAAPDRQHQVMIEAVENHMPEVIVVDEIGTDLEAEAARTIAERGVRLVATAHGQTIGNVLANPILTDLVGGIESVTLGDDEARRRRTRKTVLERRSAPTFETLIELHSRRAVVVHHDVAKSVDAILTGSSVQAESRMRLPDGRVLRDASSEAEIAMDSSMSDLDGLHNPLHSDGQLQVFAFGISRSRFENAIGNRSTNEVRMVRHLAQADVVVTSRSFHRKRERVLRDAESRGVPVYVLRNNTVVQMEACLATLLDGDDPLGHLSSEGLRTQNEPRRQHLRTNPVSGLRRA